MSTSRQHVIGKGSGGHGGGALPAVIPSGGGHGGGGHHPGGFHHWGGGPGGRGGPWFSPFVYEVPVPSYGIDLEQLLLASEAEDEKKEDRKALVKEIVKQLKSDKATVGDDLDLLDAEMIGYDPQNIASTILQTAGTLSQSGVNIWQAEEQKKQAEAEKTKAEADEKAKQQKTAAEERGRFQAARSADVLATQAAARAAFSAEQKLPSAPVDQSAAQQAAAAQARSGAGLSPASLAQRIDAATRQLAAATTKAQAAPKDGHALSLMQAWQETLNKIQNAQITTVPGPEAGGSGGSWLDGKTGPVPNKLIAGGGAVGAVAALVLGLKALFR